MTKQNPYRFSLGFDEEDPEHQEVAKILNQLGHRRDLQGQIRVSRTLDEYYDFVETYKSLDIYDRELVWSIMQAVKKSAEKRKIKVKAEEKS